MSLRATGATASRVLGQLRRDPRTIALLLVVPCVLMILVDQILADQPQTFQKVGIPLLGLFPLVSMFLVTSITMLRERTTGTLERLLTLPIAKLDLLLGYGVAFGAVAAVQATVVSAVGFGLLGLDAGTLDAACDRSCRRKRDPRHGAGTAPQCVRAHRVPGGAVHARVHPPADPALWLARPA